MAANILAQLAPGATTLLPLYQVGQGNSAGITVVTICNRSGATASFRLAIAKDGVADDPKQYLYYDLSLPGNDTFALDFGDDGLKMLSRDVMRVFASNANLTFQVFGVEGGP